MHPSQFLVSHFYINWNELLLKYSGMEDERGKIDLLMGGQTIPPLKN